MSWIDHTLPSGQVVQERRTSAGEVVFDVIGTDATIDALDAIELGRLAQCASPGPCPSPGPKSPGDHAQDAIELLAMAEGAAAVAARADFGTPAELTAARVMIGLARGLICGVFKLPDPGPQFPEDA